MFKTEKVTEPTIPVELKAKEMIKAHEGRRIQVGNEFRTLYRDFDIDMTKTEEIQARFAHEDKNKVLGAAGEALVCDAFVEGEFGKEFDARFTHPYDDFFHGVDLLIEQRTQQQVAPVVSTIDVTLNQKDIKGEGRRTPDLEEVRPLGLDKKIERIKRHIDFLANLDPKDARDLSAWIQSGGFQEPHSEKNKEFFRKAEKLLLVKYYKTSNRSVEPNKPTFILGGPQVVISLDTSFVNRALMGNSEAKEQIQAISFSELGYAIDRLQKYLDLKLQGAPDKNLFFDTYYAATKAWVHILGREDLEELISAVARKHINNPEFRAQLAYYSTTLDGAFKK